MAQPPLFRVKTKKDTYYVQTEEEMKNQLLELGLAEAVFEPGDGRKIEGEEMAKLARTLAAMEDSLIALERRGISLRIHALRQDPVTLKLPIYHVFLGSHDHWFTTRDRARRLEAPSRRKRPAASCAVADSARRRSPATAADPLPAEQAERHAPAANGKGRARSCTSSSCTRCARSTPCSPTWPSSAFRSGPDSRRTAPAPRSRASSSAAASTPPGLDDLRGLLPAIRAAGERGLTITRFKGLGEMNAEELRDTTLDPANRTLLQVTMQDAGARRRAIPHPDGRQGRAPPRIHREARAGSAEFGRVRQRFGFALRESMSVAPSNFRRRDCLSATTDSAGPIR